MLQQLTESRAGEPVAGAVFSELRSLAQTAPPGELAAFRSRVTADQYRLPYGMTRALIPRPARVLDWGCGDGHFSRFLLAEGHDVTSFSLQHRPHALGGLPEALARRHRYVQGDAAEPSRLPFPDGAFDAVTGVGVLEHVRETGGAEPASLSEIARVLRPGGLFLCFHLPNRWSTNEALARAVTGGRGGHRFRYAGAEVRALWEGAGLEILRTGRYALLPRNSFGRLPGSWTRTPAVAAAVNRIDDLLSVLLSPVCQNRYVVARMGVSIL
jgi:SAM-dependent methyltransferase